MAINRSYGRLAQLVERLLYTEDVGGSSPSSPTSLRVSNPVAYNYLKHRRQPACGHGRQANLRLHRLDGLARPNTRDQNICHDGGRMPDLNWNQNLWGATYDWPERGEEWSEGWGGSEAQWFGSIFPRLHRFLPASRILEIAPGFGRWSNFLIRGCDEYVGIDLSEKCIAACRERLPPPNMPSSSPMTGNL